jgi:hypothetical protein
MSLRGVWYFLIELRGLLIAFLEATEESFAVSNVLKAV